MRAMVLFLLGVSAIWLVLRYFPQEETLAAGAGGATAGAGGLAAPGSTVAPDAALPSRARPDKPSASGDAAAVALVPPDPAVLSAQAAPPEEDALAFRGDPARRALGASLVHEGLRGVELYLDRFGLSRDSAAVLAALSCGASAEGRSSEALEYASMLEATGDASELEMALIESSLGGRVARELPVAREVADPLERAMAMSLEMRRLSDLVAGGKYPAAARLYSDLLQAELGAPWPAHRPFLVAWTEGLRVAQEAHRWNSRGDWPSVEYVVEAGDSLSRIRVRVMKAHPGLRVCNGLINRVNGLDGRYLQPGQRLRIPLDPVSVMVDLEARWTLYLFGEEVAAAWEVGVGSPGNDTATGTFTVGITQEKPMWFPGPGMDPVPFGHPDNPLGTHWIGWDEEGVKTSLGFHGTEEADTMGQAVSAGCIRMRNEYVAELYRVIPKGSRIQVR